MEDKNELLESIVRQETWAFHSPCSEPETNRPSGEVAFTSHPGGEAVFYSYAEDDTVFSSVPGTETNCNFSSHRDGDAVFSSSESA
jgi:hypothetical protein